MVGMEGRSERSRGGSSGSRIDPDALAQNLDQLSLGSGRTGRDPAGDRGSEGGATAAAARSTDTGAAASAGSTSAAGTRRSTEAGGSDSDRDLYVPSKVIGNGSFGVVFQAHHRDTREVVAIKKVLQDRRFKNRELQIMRSLNHPNILALKTCYYTNGDKPDEVFLNLVLEYFPETLYRIERHHSKAKNIIATVQTKLYTYQLLRALAYIHAKGVCHRDIKPQNLLLDTERHILNLCDFGSAKILVKGEPNIAYICSRYYRAPELIFGATDYTPAIDVWSTGCVMAELLLGQPLFPGQSSVDQLVEIIKVLGTPTKAELYAMNRNYTEFKFPQVKQYPWAKVFRSKTPPEAIDLLSKLLCYTPETRLKPLAACAHPFFDELRDPNFRLPRGGAAPPLFNFTEEEIQAAGPELMASLRQHGGSAEPEPEPAGSTAAAAASPPRAS